MARKLLILFVAAWASQVFAQTAVQPTLSVRDQAQLAEQLNLQLGRDIVALTRGDYETQIQQIRMIPGFKGELDNLKAMVAELRTELEKHKQALSALLAENDELRRQLADASAPTNGGQP
jgi:uncharacterized coiled-coil DUF342 family protein